MRDPAEHRCRRCRNFYSTAQRVGRLCDRRRWSSTDGPADQGGGKSAAPGEPRRHRRVRAGAGAGFLRSRSRARRSRAHGVPADRQNLLTALAAQRARIAANRGDGSAHPDRHRHLADAGRAARRVAVALPGGALASVGADLARRCLEGRRDSPTASRSRSCRNLDEADVILAIDSDLLSSAPGHLRFAREFAARRNPTRTQQMSRGLCGRADADADRVRSPTIASSPARAKCIRSSWRWPRESCSSRAPPSGAPDWVGKAIADLAAKRGRALVHVGPDQPAETHALVHAMNEKLGARGSHARTHRAGRRTRRSTRRRRCASSSTTCAPGKVEHPADHRQQPGLRRARQRSASPRR